MYVRYVCHCSSWCDPLADTAQEVVWATPVACVVCVDKAVSCLHSCPREHHLLLYTVHQLPLHGVCSSVSATASFSPAHHGASICEVQTAQALPTVQHPAFI